MAFTATINTGTTPNNNQGAGLRTNMRILIANDVDLKATKVDKVTGKDLSTNDFTTLEKQKLANLSPRKTHIVEGVVFDYIPVYGSDGSTFQDGDLIANGRKSATEFWVFAEYNAPGNADFFAAWTPISQL